MLDDVIYLVLLILSLIVCFSLFIYLIRSRQKKQIHIPIIAFSMLQIIHCASLIFQIFQILLKGTIDPAFFENFAYISGCFFPVAVFFTGLIYAKTKIRFKKWYLLLLVVPILSLVLLWTNSYHHLFYLEYSINIKDTVFGPYFPIHSLYSYTLILIGLIYLLKYTIRNSGFFSKQSLFIIIGTIIPLGINVLGLFGVPMTVYFTPISFTLTILFYSLAIFKFQFLTVSPIALQKIVDRISDGYVVLDSDNNVIDYNATFIKTFSSVDNSIRNKSILTLIKKYDYFDIDLDVLKETLETVQSSDKTFNFEKKSNKFNKYFIIEINGIYSKNDFLGTLILFKDTTQHMLDMQTIKNNQDMLMEKERLASLGQLIGGIAHNLKTPIMSISGAAEGIQDLVKEYNASIEDPEVTPNDHHAIASDMSDWIVKIKDYTEYMSDVITAVKGQAVVLSSEQNVSFTLEELIKRVDILMKHELKNALISLNVKISVDKDTILKGDINSLVQVINNMISNSIQAYGGQTDKEIDLWIEENNNTIILSIQDYGSGMTEEIKNKLFKEMITTKGKNGTGLGLFMSYSTIRAHFGGNITFDSEKGKGTIFKITLPNS